MVTLESLSCSQPLLDLCIPPASPSFAHTRPFCVEAIKYIAITMLHIHALKSFSKSPYRGQLAFLQDCRAYSSHSGSDSDTADLDAAREWFQRFKKSTIPEKLGKTSFSKSSGPGGQKTNKYVDCSHV